MNKGALITSRHKLAAQDRDYLRRLAPDSQVWRQSGVVIRGVYEGRIYIVDALSGKNIGTELAPVVDIMIGGKLIKEVPIRCLDKVEKC
jgi:hypothetical protein